MDKLRLRLYVTGQTVRSERAIANLYALCEAEFHDRYEVTVIDVLEQPELAEQDKVFATPTLVKDLPPPIRRIIGDLTDREQVLVGLDVLPVDDGGAW